MISGTMRNVAGDGTRIPNIAWLIEKPLRGIGKERRNNSQDVTQGDTAEEKWSYSNDMAADVHAVEKSKSNSW